MEEKDTGRTPDETGRENVTGAGKDNRRRNAIIAGVAAVVVVALCGGGFAAWRVHENRLDEQARTSCAQATKRLDTSHMAWEKLLNDARVGAGRIQAGQVQDPKTVEALKKAMNAKVSTGSVSCTTGTRDQVNSATKTIRKAAKAYDANTDTLRKTAKAVEASKLDRTVADATKLLADTKGKVKDDKTRQDLDKAIKARDEQAIAKAVKAVNDSKAAKDKADAEAKAKKAAEEAAAAAAKAAQQQAAASSSSGYSSGYSSNNFYRSNSDYSGSYGYNSGSYNSGYSNSNRSYSAPSSGGSTSSKPSTSTPSQSTGSSNSSAGASDGFDWTAGDQYDCKPGKFCPLG